MVRKIGEGAMANSIGDQEFDSFFPEPAREQSRLMFWCREGFHSKNRLRAGIYFNQGEFTGSSEMAMEAPVFNGNGDFYSRVHLFLF